LGVHAQLDDLEGNLAADRLLLLSHIDHATAALANLLQKPVAADSVAGFFRRVAGSSSVRTRGPGSRRGFEALDG